MKFKHVVFALLMTSPFYSLANDKNEVSNDPKQQNVDFVLEAQTKTVEANDAVIKQENNKTEESVAEEKTPFQSSKYKPVPIVGDLDYYGTNHNAMVNYTQNYMRNFRGRIGRNTNKDRIFTTMEKILISYDIPVELKYLAVIESALNGNARSKAGAVGYWQFMAPTARDMGLVVNNKRDDRTNLSRSTHAAAKYLSYLYNQLDDWLLVVAAYNSGPRPVINAIKRTGQSDFWAIKRFLPRETQNHVMAFIATATIMEKLDEYIVSGLPNNFDWASLNHKANQVKEKEENQNPLLKRFPKEELQKMAIIRINKPLDFARLAQVLSVDSRLLAKWNYDYADYINSYEAGQSYNLRIPKEKLDLFLEKKSQIENPNRF